MTVKDLKKIAEMEESRTQANSLVSDFVGALCGDGLALVKLSKELIKSPMFFTQQLFWAKFINFLEGVNYSEEEAARFTARMAEEEYREGTAERIITCIDRCEDRRKIKFMVDATHNWIWGHISRTEYLRMIKQISETLFEALEFMRQCDLKGEYRYTEFVQDLFDTGLMYISQTTFGSGMIYAFSQNALLLDKWALSYREMDKYSYGDKTDAESLPEPSMKTVATFG